MDWLKEQFAQSTIISGILAVGIWGAIIALSIMQAPIPDVLYAGGMSVVGFFFGSKVGQAQGEARAYRSLEDGFSGKYRKGVN